VCVERERQTNRQERLESIHEQILDDLKDTRGYWKLKEKALDYKMWRTCFGRGRLILICLLLLFY
jgi:hypothetical protein